MREESVSRLCFCGCRAVLFVFCFVFDVCSTFVCFFLLPIMVNKRVLCVFNALLF